MHVLHVGLCKRCVLNDACQHIVLIDGNFTGRIHWPNDTCCKPGLRSSLWFLPSFSNVVISKRNSILSFLLSFFQQTRQMWSVFSHLIWTTPLVSLAYSDWSIGEHGSFPFRLYRSGLHCDAELQTLHEWEPGELRSDQGGMCSMAFYRNAGIPPQKSLFICWVETKPCGSFLSLHQGSFQPIAV